MNESITVKIISQDQCDFEEIARTLEARYKVLATSRAIFDNKTGKWHIFLNLEALP